MPVRGHRSIYPEPGKKPTGIFRQGQKLDSTSEFSHKDVQNYALGAYTRSKPKGDGGQGLRHQPPKRSSK